MSRSLLLLATIVAASVGALGGCRDAHQSHESHQSHGSHQADPQHEPHQPAAAAASPSGSGASNPVQAEMQLLHGAMQTTLTAIADGDVRGVPHALHRVHEAKAATEAALEHGGYRPPKNGDRLTRFHELDKAFHGELERLVEASEKNDVARTSEAFGAAMRACNGCHSEFRR